MIFQIYFIYDYSSGRKEHESCCISLTPVFWIPIQDQPFQNISTPSLQRRINHHHQIGQAYVWLLSVSHFNDVQKKQKQKHIVPFEKSDWKVRVPVKHVGGKKLKTVVPNKKIIIQYFKKFLTFSSFSCCAQTHNNIYNVCSLHELAYSI